MTLPPALRARPWRTNSLDLKWVLVRRILLVALICMTGGAGLVLRDVRREAINLNEEAAATVARQLALQLTRIDAALDRPERFPDWEPLANYSLRPGQCIQFVAGGSHQVNSNCQGIDMHEQVSPDWFVNASTTFLGQSVVQLPLIHKGEIKGAVVATVEAAAIAGRAWQELSRLVGIGAAMIVSMCFLVYLVIARSLRPTAEILSGLNRLADGDLVHRLPRFKLKELDRISEVFNGMAQRLETSTQERSELSRKLVNAQEQERLHIARELHDDVAQRLSAISGLAASIRRVCQHSSPAATRQSEELVAVASSTMRALRDTLTYLRPPEIDDLGLIASLQSLIQTHNALANSMTTFSLETSGIFDDLPTEMSAHVYRIVQEGLNNAARHANARTVRVLLKSSIKVATNARRIDLAVTDDGCSPQVETREGTAGVGLVGIRERVYALSGAISAGHRDGRGFELQVSFPVQSVGVATA
ncbi:histidine kinase [Hyphomicrobium sp. LHD-15]|uniref:sensor histidine kinase n=1 Tax=Hyphomicrobium sp. LHD-15 TaxID=3072142 RepID=UPI00280F6C99|nr:histidine kinase [Hyphomicrobium sp. LHD-15]MDQ8700643.1 histidine kinase [Hyphomicrobium sp. LHD-15]